MQLSCTKDNLSMSGPHQTETRIASGLLLLCVSLLVVSPARAESLPVPKGHELTGRVLDPTGAVIPGASVTLFSQGLTPIRSTQTDEAGWFRLEGVPAGRFEPVARAKGKDSGSGLVRVPQGGTQ